MNSSKGKGQFEDEGRFGERDGSETGRFGDRAVRRQGGSGTVRTETGDGSLSPFFVKRRQRTVPCLPHPYSNSSWKTFQISLPFSCRRI